MPYKFNPLSGDLDYYVAGSGNAWSDPVDANIVPDAQANNRNIGSTSDYFNSIFCGTLNSKNSVSIMNSSKQTEGQILATTTSPSGVSLAFGVRNASYTDNWGIFTESNASANATNVATLYIEGGNKTAGTGNGGDINIRAGSSAGGTGGGITLETAAGASGTTGGIYLNGNSRLGYSTYGGAAGTFSIGDNISTVVFTGANAVTLNLPTAVGRTGSIYTFVINGDTNQLTVGTSGTETIAGQSTVVLGEVGEGLIVQSDGSNWQLANRSNLYKTVSAHIETVGGTASVVAEHGNWISSITNTATGDYTVNITSGVFSNAPVPVVSAFDNSAYLAHIVVAPTTAAVRVRIANTSGTLVDGGTGTEGFMIMCHGY